MSPGGQYRLADIVRGTISASGFGPGGQNPGGTKSARTPASATNCSFNNGECYEFSQCGTGECCNSSNGECTTNCIHDNITDKMTTEDIAGTALAAPQGSSPSLVSSLAVPGRLLNDRHRHPGAVSVVAVHLQTICCLQRRRHALLQKLLREDVH